ncbi:nuclear transport factor 2 family protein [Elizabethkingia ursingii]|uniref:nuclear transport factor 2 family protein n=1 Tax=Elizabethkingia ursingii TaxID=1756150 RepID=UPI002012D03C|nr:nuclear transport factor 2 family protein [Elizabethkingia ursingii]MCL1673786.1 nuclear transport factor 2 family protein [Elizabethkingia ursingii]
MEKQTQQVVEQYYHNLALGNYEANVQLFADHVEWRIPGNAECAVWIKDRNTKEEVSTFFKELYENIEGISFDVSGKFYHENRAVVTGHLVSRVLSTGKLFDSHFTVQFTIDNGLITKYLMLEDSYGLVEALSQNSIK